MSDYQRILVATDLNDASTAVARRGAELAHHYGASLTLLHVIEHFPEDIPVSPVAPEDVDPTAFYTERARQNLAKLAKTIGHQDAVQEVIVSPESARHEILRFAEQQKSELIIVGSHGGGVFEALGSTTMGVVYDARCDAMIIRLQN
jgi:universal stress protein A